MQIPHDQIPRLLEQAPVARLATLGREGVPVLVPIVYVFVDNRLWSPVDAKPKRGGELARVRNIRRDPRVCALVDHYTSDWARLWWIRIDGRAQIEPASRAEPALAALRRKYPQYATVPLLDPSRTLIAVEPERIRSWSAAA